MDDLASAQQKIDEARQVIETTNGNIQYYEQKIAEEQSRKQQAVQILNEARDEISRATAQV